MNNEMCNYCKLLNKENQCKISWKVKNTTCEHFEFKNSDILPFIKRMLIDEYSGGVKLTKLASSHKILEYFLDNNEFFMLETAIKNNSKCGIKVLNYLYPTINREKTFLYIPLEDENE